MPAFGFSESEAKDVAAFLMDTSTPARLNTAETPAWKEGDIDAGQKLLLTTGCSACHAMSQLPDGFEPQAAPFHGPDLSNVVERREHGMADDVVEGTTDNQSRSSDAEIQAVG